MVMKSSVRVQKNTTMKQPARKTSSTSRGTRSRSGTVSGIGRSVKRYGKKTLREILLSKTFHATFKVFVGLLISGSALYGAYAFIGNSVANDIVISQSEILARVGKHIQLPEGMPETVVRVQDSENLKNQNSLYENVKEGDYIIMYPELAVIYDLRNDHIVAMRSSRR